jgi:SAM-dependent methyltransferase
MGLPWQSLVLLIREHQASPFEDPVLLLGRQHLNVNYDTMLRLLEAENCRPAPLPAGENLRTNIPSAIGTPSEDVASDTLLFKLLGLKDIRALDYSPHEGAEIVADLNCPVQPEFHNRFGLIVDAGTIEHVFDMRQGLSNVAEMLKPGGRVVHITPVNNYVNHGFYQVSPTLFYDYYGANGFADLHATILLHPRIDYMHASWDGFEYDPAVHGGLNSFFCDRDSQLIIKFTATKTAESTSDKVPIQSYFTRLYSEGEAMEWKQFLFRYDNASPTVEVVRVGGSE